MKCRLSCQAPAACLCQRRVSAKKASYAVRVRGSLRTWFSWNAPRPACRQRGRRDGSEPSASGEVRASHNDCAPTGPRMRLWPKWSVG